MWKQHPDILTVGYEKYGMQADTSYMRERQKKEGLYFNIIELGGQTSKVDRIQRLVPLFETGRFYLPHRAIYKNQDMIKTFIDDEYSLFPFCLHDDMLDAIARIADPALKITRPNVDEGPDHTQQKDPPSDPLFSGLEY